MAETESNCSATRVTVGPLHSSERKLRIWQLPTKLVNIRGFFFPDFPGSQLILQL